MAMGLYGAWRGGIRQLGSVAAFLLGFLAAKIFAPQVTGLFQWPSAVSYALVFSAVFVVVTILARVLKLTVKMLLLGPIDRLLGLLIGAAKWLLFASLTLNLLWLLGIESSTLHTPVCQWVGRFAETLFGFAQTYIQ